MSRIGESLCILNGGVKMNEVVHVLSYRDCLLYTDKIRNRIQEHFGVILLNANHDVIVNKVLFKGGINNTIVDPKIIFYYAIKHRATAMIIYHNHPSGNPEPSTYDIKLTESLRDGCKLLGMQLLDHLIVPKGSFNELYSFMAETEIFNN